MKSFTKKLIISFTGVIFTSFLIVYFLFNILAGNYIRGVAAQELADGMIDVVGLIYAFPTFGNVGILSFQPEISRTIEGVTSPFGVRLTVSELPYMRMGGFEMTQWYTIERFPHEHTSVTILPKLPLQREDIFIIEGVVPALETEWIERQFTFSNIRPVPQRSIIDADVIILNEQNEITTPFLEILPYRQRAEVQFLADYYLTNRARFTNGEMVRVASAGNTFYLSTVTQVIEDEIFSILMYTDISSAMVFTNTMNRILGLLLAVSGILSLVISVAMSAKFKRSIVRLCGYADTIGRGNFTETAGVFNDTEFNQLSVSMNNMSNMLQTYENNQKQFFQNVSHELRTPLMSIQGYAEGILKDIFSKEEAADIILSEGQKMAALVDELLYVSRIDAAIETPETITTLDVKTLVYECSERVKPIARNMGKQVEAEFMPECVCVTADEEKLERAVVNILSNAIRHAKSDVKISCQVENDNVKIIVEDDGDGINPADLPHIFDRFYKGENGNYGLGLAISKDIVKRLGGSIKAENKTAPETGAVFTILLPTADGQN
ncbi:MAG: HAMP domain-containing histidine kinase [Firmicutes bacterium]|nr:HAMP domain-containing histidine kinase [Bacillota bacterium]